MTDLSKRLLLAALTLALSACQKQPQSQTQTQTQQPQTQPPSQSQAPCAQDFLGGQAVVQVKTFILCHSDYVVLYDPKANSPVYSAEHLTPAQMTGKQARSEGFTPDPLLPASEQIDTRTYSRSGYDRGHLSPAADFKGEGADVMAQSFYTSNIAPQNPTMNREGWQAIENMTRDCARQLGGAYVITGVITEPNGKRLKGPDSPVIPSAYWKVIYTEKDYRAILMPNTDTPKQSSYRQFYTSLQDIQQRARVTVGPQLSLNRQQPGSLCKGIFS